MSDADEILTRPIGPPDYDEDWDRIDGRYFDRKGNPISMRDWARLFEHGGMDYKRVAYDEVENYEISTVWLGLDHGWRGTRQIFETMVFDTTAPNYNLFELLPEDFDLRFDEIPEDIPERPEVTRYQDLDVDRYATEEEALAGHAAMVEKVKAKVALLKEATS